MHLSFWKYHGLGNDFVIFDGREVDAFYKTPAWVRRICHRHRGIGGDGVLWLEHSMSADFRMVIANADGTRPEMCGNGLRCFARFLYDRGYTRAREFTVETDRGVLECVLEVNEHEDVQRVRIEMGPPILERSAIPVAGEGDVCIDESLSLDSEELRITALSMGNPHVVLFDISEEKRLSLGPLLEAHPLFPQRTNVEFVEVVAPLSLRVAVYERGCGWTQACGTGACAAVVAALLTNRIQVPEGAEVQVELPGGILGIEVAPDRSNVWMTGTATPVFSGTLRVPIWA